MISCFFSPPLNQAMRAARWAEFFAAMLFLAACGPGTGGTGNGENTAPLEFFGATPANVCITGPASALACPPIGNPGAVGANESVTASHGSGGAFFTDISGANDVVVGVSINSVWLTAGCPDLHFEGDWGVASGDDARYFGRYRFGPDGQSVLASLTVQAIGSDKWSLSAVLRDHEGRVVLGPLLLRRVIVPVSNPLACPG